MLYVLLSFPIEGILVVDAIRKKRQQRLLRSWH